MIESGNVCVIHCPGLLYTALMEKIFNDRIPYNCKRKLKQLLPSELDSVADYRQQERQFLQTRDPEARTLLNLSKFYGTDEVAAMSWTLHHNAALSLHRSEKASKL